MDAKTIRALKVLVGEDPPDGLLQGFLEAHGDVVSAANAYLEFKKKRKHAVIDLPSSDEEVTAVPSARSAPSAPSAPSVPSAPAVASKSNADTTVTDGVSRGFCVPIGSAQVMGYSTTSIPRNAFFRVQSTMGPALRPDCACTIDFTLTGLRPKDRRTHKLDYADSDVANLRRLPPHMLPAHVIVRISINGVGEIGTLPAAVSRLIVPPFLYGMIDIHCRLSSSSELPDELQMGTDVPLVLYVALTDQAFAPPSVGGMEDIMRTCYTGLFDLIGIRRLRGEAVVLEAAPCTIVEIDSDSCDEECWDKTQDVGALAHIGALDHRYLPTMTPPSEKFTLRDYQKRAVYFMWRRENPGKEPPRGLCSAVLPVDMGLDETDDSNKRLHPQWEERSVAGECIVDGSIVRSFYYNPGAGKLSLSFPDRSEASCRGGILADEMGLGKTVMTLALVSLDYAPNVTSARTSASVPRSYGEPPAKAAKTCIRAAGTLIVAPLSLLHQWQSEWEKYIGGDVFQYYGSQRPKDPEQLMQYELVLTSYGTLQAERGTGTLSQVYWRRIILDEAHMIKGRTTQIAVRVNALHAWTRWCLSGTPMQNSIDELFPLVHFLKAEPYSIYQIWRKVISTPLAEGREEEAMKALHAIMKPLLIRRTKETKDEFGKPIISLPPRETEVVWIDLPSDERERYDHVYRASKDKAYALLAGGGSSYTHILQLILKLRMLLCHHSLVRSTLTTSTVTGTTDAQRRVLERIKEDELPECPLCREPPTDPVLPTCGHVYCLECAYLILRKFKGMCPLCRVGDALRLPFLRLEGAASNDKLVPSTKMATVLRMAREDMIAGRKILIFSQWTCFLNLIEKMFTDEKLPHRRLDGTQTMEQRRAAASWLEEQSGGCILLISLKAGGVGLNLISATKVYLMDLWWNPAVEEQALQRVHRIGQTKPVTCIKLVVRNSMDEKVLKLQSKKLHLVQGVMQMNARMTLEDLKDLFL